MADLSGNEARPFNLDAILSEFNVGNEPAFSHPPPDEAVARVRKSLGLGRSIFRRKDSLSEQGKDNELGELQEDRSGIDLNESNDEDAPRTSKTPRRIVETDDEDGLPITKPRLRTSLPVLSITQSPASPLGNIDSGSEDEFSTEKLVEDFRKARAEALANFNAKAAAKSQEEQQATEDEISLVSEQSHSPARSSAQSPSPSARKTRTRRASKKALEDMQRETQRMARNMALRPEVKVSKTIDMNTIFAKFGYNPTKLTDEKAVELSDQQEQAGAEAEEFAPTDKNARSTNLPADSAAPIRFATPNLDASDSDESLPSPSKLASYLSQMPAKPPTPPTLASKFTSPRKVHFTLPPSPSASGEDSDVEILPPPNLLNTHATTPDRKSLKRTALIRSLAGVKSPRQMKKSPGRMTATELDATLSREAAVQAKRKREERRAELKSLGIDLEKIIEKRDLLEEAREEARRVREEEGVDDESDDEEYFDEEAENDGDDEESGEESGQENVDEDEDMADSGDETENEDENQDEIIQDVSTKRRGRKFQITSDDEDETLQSQDAVIPESTIGSHHNHLCQVQTTDDLSLTQFFRPTQISDIQQTAPILESQSQTSGGTTGLTQFFQSTAMEEDMELNEDAAHGQMELLRQQAAKGHTGFRDLSISFPAPFTTNSPSSRPLRSPSLSPLVESPIRRRILKRRAKPRDQPGIAETSEEFMQSKKEFIEEQAEESDDDYKAWGSGDESENENMDGVVEGLIDDETKVKKNTEEEVARLYMFLPTPKQLILKGSGTRKR